MKSFLCLLEYLKNLLRLKVIVRKMQDFVDK